MRVWSASMKFHFKIDSPKPRGCRDYGVISRRAHPDPDLDLPFTHRILTWALF